VRIPLLRLTVVAAQISAAVALLGSGPSAAAAPALGSGPLAARCWRSPPGISSWPRPPASPARAFRCRSTAAKPGTARPWPPSAAGASVPSSPPRRRLHHPAHHRPRRRRRQHHRNHHPRLRDHPPHL